MLSSVKTRWAIFKPLLPVIYSIAWVLIDGLCREC